MKNTLHLASGSVTRRKLLEESNIPYKIIKQHSDEPEIETNSATEQVLHLSADKIKCVDMEGIDKTIDAFIITADTLVQTCKTSQIFGKPRDIQHAKYMMKTMREEAVDVITGCYLEKKHWNGTQWQTVACKQWTTKATLELHIPEGHEEEFIKIMPISLHACGGTIVEGYGQQFLKSIQGSYSSLLGLPMYELKEMLRTLGFYK
ncbi:Maf family protein [Candidatus Babeliales bacterium]|nr:Maf family protein [Candidatus Babeliales bacterium]